MKKQTKTKTQIIERLKGNIKDIRALIKDINAWDIYHDENWENMIEGMEEAIQYINKTGKKANG